MEKIAQIRSPLIDNYTRIVKSLARQGRTAYQQYLIRPLGGWTGTPPREPIDELMRMINEAEIMKSPKLPLLYKLSIIKSVEPDQLDMSVPGNLALNFLKSMKDFSHVALSLEALEFVNLLRIPFRDYSDIEFQRMNKKFDKEISSAANIEVEKLIKIHEGQSKENQRITAEAQVALD